MAENEGEQWWSSGLVAHSEWPLNPEWQHTECPEKKLTSLSWTVQVYFGDNPALRRTATRLPALVFLLLNTLLFVRTVRVLEYLHV